ncbi:uncharacterized protein F5891DRAFT_1185370 [Suillus fuscotomentosus]|uniref:Uncharacterized protein n=1 Tax=Suillus fuscotomentosus TaxID=1912939 RepID=A0AAD4HP29_9AGAM|nr:uncharacterized protein F5891DRAFT_1185370 [Suillus fuscotomentosus]KAG1903733.1 hypothetical protein F5891DRAFT_1185370 [Suillus fuscotomentosus]
MEQFIEAIRMVQNGHVPPSSPKPYGWPYRPEDEVCSVHTQTVSHSPEDRSPAKEEDTSSEVSIDDICIGPVAAAADNSLDSSSSENGGESSMSGTETLADLDPALEFNWFVTTSHFGVGLYSEISTTRTLHAPGTTVHYFTTLHEAKEYFRLALAVWCGETV